MTKEGRQNLFREIVEEWKELLDRDLTEIDKVLKTGNLMVDAILNSKLSLAINEKININTRATVPENYR